MRFLIVAVLVLGGCKQADQNRIDTKPAKWCVERCCSNGLAVESFNWGCSCVHANSYDLSTLEKLRAIQCGEEPKL